MKRDVLVGGGIGALVGAVAGLGAGVWIGVTISDALCKAFRNDRLSRPGGVSDIRDSEMEEYDRKLQERRERSARNAAEARAYLAGFADGEQSQPLRTDAVQLPKNDAAQ